MLDIESFDEATVNELRSRARNALLTEAMDAGGAIKVKFGPQQGGQFTLVVHDSGPPDGQPA